MILSKRYLDFVKLLKRRFRLKNKKKRETLGLCYHVPRENIRYEPTILSRIGSSCWVYLRVLLFHMERG